MGSRRRPRGGLRARRNVDEPGPPVVHLGASPP